MSEIDVFPCLTVEFQWFKNVLFLFSGNQNELIQVHFLLLGTIQCGLSMHILPTCLQVCFESQPIGDAIETDG